METLKPKIYILLTNRSTVAAGAEYTEMPDPKGWYIAWDSINEKLLPEVFPSELVENDITQFKLKTPDQE